MKRVSTYTSKVPGQPDLSCDVIVIDPQPERSASEYMKYLRRHLPARALIDIDVRGSYVIVMLVGFAPVKRFLRAVEMMPEFAELLPS